MTIFKRFAIGSRQIAVCIVLGLLIVNLARAEDVRPTGKHQQLIKDQSGPPGIGQRYSPCFARRSLLSIRL